MLSILLPSYNNRCVELVKELHEQASSIEGLEYEIIVADDGGNDQAIKKENALINTLPNCRYIIRTKNVGRSAIRNYLASVAKGNMLLFIDSDIKIVREDFIARYATQDGVVDGGVEIVGNPKEMRHNLRFWYEYKSAPQHTAEQRMQVPYQHIHTANLLVPTDVFNEIKFDERFIRYGYEDVLFGKGLEKHNIKITHIDNPVGLDKFESNIKFIKKTEEGISTLKFFRKELSGYSSLLKIAGNIERWHMTWIVKFFHFVFYPMLKLNLISRHPSLHVFYIYKLCYFISKA